MRSLSSFILILFITAGCTGIEYDTFEFSTDRALDHDLVSVNVPIAGLQGEVCLEAGGVRIPAQAETLTPSRVRIWWFATQGAGESVEYSVLAGESCSEEIYSWQPLSDQSVQLLLGDQPLIQYEFPIFDPENLEETKKPFHHVYGPGSGELITKGAGGLYSHHRGIFYGYSRVEIYDDVYDMWHANSGERTEHIDFISEFSGPVFGGHIAEIHWKDPNDRIILEEERDIRVFREQDGSVIIDFHTNMYAIAGPVNLDGDLQHAGMQFRAAQYVADNPGSSRFIRPASFSHVPGNIELGEEDRVGLPWNALNFTMDGTEYTVVYMVNPENPGRSVAEMSERLYGRFGEFFPHYFSEGAPFVLRYRLWVVEGDAPSVEEIEARYQQYATR